MFAGKKRTVRIITVGSAVVIKSGFSLKDWEKAVEYDPEIGLYDDQDKQFFSIRISEGYGELNEKGVVFSKTPTDDGFACVTMLMDVSVTGKEERRRWIMQRFGRGFDNLLDVENHLQGVIAPCWKQTRPKGKRDIPARTIQKSIRLRVDIGLKNMLPAGGDDGKLPGRGSNPERPEGQPGGLRGLDQNRPEDRSDAAISTLHSIRENRQSPYIAKITAGMRS